MLRFLRRIIIFFVTLFVGKRRFMSLQSSVLFSSEANPKKLRNFISTILTFKEDIGYETLLEHLKKVVLPYIPFHSRVVPGKWFWPYYKPIKDFNLEDHVFEETLKEGTDEELLNKLGDICSLSGDPNKPLHSWHLIHNYQKDGSKGCAVIIRIHHAIFDGSMAVKYFFYLTKKKEEEGGEKTTEEKKKRKKRLKYPAPNFFQKIWLFLSSLFKVLFQKVDDPTQFFGHSGGVGDRRLNGRFNISEPYVFVDEMKKVAHKFECTINDVVESCIAGGVRKYLLLHGTKFDQESLKMKKSRTKSVTWVNLRKESFPKLLKRLCASDDFEMEDEDFNVDFGTIVHNLPYHVESHIDRMKHCHKKLKKLLFSPEPYLIAFLIDVMGFIPPFLCKMMWETLGYVFSFSVSNVPGAQHERTFCGADLDSIGFYVIPNGTISEMVTVFSYNKKMMWCINGVKSQEVVDGLFQCIMDVVQEHIAL